MLKYVPSRQKLLFYCPRRLSFYDPDKNSWQEASPGGPQPPFGIDPTACHDPKRDRMYIGGGAYPIAKGPNPLWIYEVDADRWLEPMPNGVPGGNHFGTNVAMMSCDSRKDRVYLFRYRGTARGVYVYDVKKCVGCAAFAASGCLGKRPYRRGLFPPGARRPIYFWRP